MTKKPPLTLVGSTPTDPAPPRTLGNVGLNLWHRVQNEYGISDVGGIELLAQICAAADRGARLAEQIDAVGEVHRTPSGLKAHPCLKDELACRSFVVRGLERLGVTVEPIKAVGRPPGNYP